jgi:hypothetical protein
MDNLRKRAKDLRQTGNYPEAFVLYSHIMGIQQILKITITG